MSGRKSKKNQRLGSSRRGPKGLNRNIEKDDDDDGFQQIAVSEDGRNDFHTSTDYHSTQFDHPPSSSIDQQTSPLESLPHDKDSLMETELPERKRKMGSTRKSAGRFKVERKLDEVRTTEEFEEEYVTRPNTSTTEEQHEEEQSRPMSFPSDLSHSSGLGKEPGTTPMFVVSENEEKDAIHRQEITSHSHEVVNNMPINEAMGTSVHSFAVTAESDSLQKDSVMFDEPKTLCRQEIATASTSGQKRRMGSTRRPLGGKNSVQEHSRNMTENERKAEVMGETKLKMSEEMVQAWDDVARDDPSSHTVSALVSNQTLLAEKAELKETDISSGTETMNQTVAFPLVDSEKPLPETSHHYGTSLLNEELDFKFGSHTDDLDVLNKDAGSDNSYVPDTRKDTNPSYDFRDVNTETKEEVLKQKGELSINDQMSSLLPKQDTRLEELALNDQESSLSQHDLDNNCNSSVPQLIVGGSGSFDVPLSNISHDEPTATNLPHEMSDAVEERREIHIEKEQGNNLCNVAAVACDTPTDLESITEEDEEPQNLAMRENENMSDERGSETENAFEMTGQDDARDHSVTQIIMDVRDNEKDGETITETIWISHQTVSEVSAEKEEIYREEVQYSSNISQTHSPQQDDAEKMLENDEVTNDKKETENTAVNDVTSKPEEMFSFEDSATDTGSHAHQLFMQSPFKEGCDLHERVSEKSEKKKIFFSVESENAPSDKGDGRSEGTEGIKEMDAAPVVILDVDTNDSESENPEQNRALTEEQNDTSSDTNLQVLQISDNVSSVIDSGLLFHDVIDVSLGERERVPEKSDISSFIPDDSQDFYKPTTFHPESQENTGDPESAAVGGDTDLHLEIEAQNKTFDLTSEAEGTEKNMQDASVLAREVEVIADTVTVESNMTTELDFLQSSPDVHVEALNLSEKAKKEVSGETDTILEQSNISSIPQDSHGEEAHSKSSPVIQKRKMGSTRRPLKGKKGQRQEHDEKEICNLGDEPSPDESTLRSSKDGAKEREVEICEEKDVEEVEVIGDKVTMLSIMTTESDFLQSSPDAHVEALDLFKNAGKEVSGETDTILKQSDINIIAEDSYGEEAHSKSSPVIHKRKMGSTRRPLKGNKGRRKEMEHQDENETLDSEGVISVEKETINLEDEPSPDESTLQSLKDGDKEQMEICENKDVGPVEGSESALLQSSCSSDLVSVKSTAISICHVTESRDLTKMNEESQENAGDVERVQADLQLKTYLQNETFDITTSEAEGTEENTQDVSFMLIREVKVIGDTVTVESNLTTETDFLQTSPDAHVEALEVSENAEKEVSGETDKILKQNDISIIPEDSHGEEAHSESSPIVHKRKMGSTRRPLKGKKGQRQEHDEKEICNLGDEPSPDESTLRSSKDEVKEQEVEICEKNDFGSVEGVESAVLQSSCNSDLAFEESTAISMENAGAAERVPGEEDKDLQLKIESENKTFDLTTSEAERTEENIQDVSVTLVREVEVIGDTVTVESNLTIESNFLQSSPDANIEALKLSENAKKEFSGETDTIAEQSNISSIPQDSHREEAHSKLSPVIHKRKMGSTRRPLKGNKGRRKEMEHQDENESLDSEGMISAEKETINLEDEPSPDESTLQCSKDGAKEQEVEICGSESALLQTSSSSDLVSEESTTISICHVTESQTPIKINEESQENAGAAENVPAEEDKHLQIKIDPQKQTFYLTTNVAEGTEENIQDISTTLVREVEVIGDTVTVESNLTTESVFCQTSPDANMEVSENTDSEVSSDTQRNSHTEIQPENKMIDLTYEAERIEEIICETGASVKEEEFIVDTVIGENNMTTESNFLQSDTLNDAKLEAFNLSNNTESVSAVTDSLLLVQDDVNEGSRETDTFPEQSDIKIIPEDSYGEEAHSKSSPFVHKRKMGSTRRPLRGNKGQREEIEHHDENTTPDSEAMISVEKETINLEDEPSPDESTLRSLKDEVKEQMEISEENDVGPVVESKSALMQSSCSSDLVSDESTTISICHVTESQSITTIDVESQENTGDAERVAADLQLKIDSQSRTFDIINKAEGTEENIQDVNVTLVREVEVIGDTVESNMTTVSDFLQTSADANIEALKVSDNTEKELLGKTDTILKQSDINIIPADSHREETHSESSPVIHKRKMGSTRRPLKGKKGQRQEHDEKEILEDEPCPDQSGYTAVSICDISESQTLTKLHAGSQKNTGDVEIVPAEEDKDLQLKIDSQNKTFDVTTSEAEGTEENIHDVSVTLVKEAEVVGDTVTVETNMTTESDAHIEALKVFENAEKEVSGETDKIPEQSDISIIPEDSYGEEAHSVDTVTVESNMTTESDFLQTSPDTYIKALQIPENPEKDVSGETDTIPEQSHINIIPADSHREEAHSKSSPVIHKRKMGSTRRPLRGNKGQREEIEHHDKNETLDSEGMISTQKDTFSLKDEPSTYESTIQSSKDGAKEQKIGIQEENDVGPVEGSESTDLQSLCSSDLVSEESTAISICHITGSQTLTKMSEESQETAGEAERVSAKEDKDIQLKIDSQNKTFDLTTSETEENIQDVSVMLVREIEVTGDSVTVESKMTAESDFLQTSDSNMEAREVSENAEEEVSGETDTIPEQSHINIIPADSHREEAHSKSSPVIHKRKMGSTRRPLRGNKGQREEIEHHDKNETLDSEGMISTEKDTFSLKDEPSTYESTIQSSKDGAKEQKIGIQEENDVGPVEGSESTDLQSLCSSDLVSEESTAISICHITESQTLTKMSEESQETAGEAERVSAKEDKDVQLKIDSQNKTFDLTTSETEENIQDVSVMLVREIELTGDTVTVESKMTAESDFLQTSDSNMEAGEVSENAEEEVSGETDTIPEQSHINIIPADSHREEAHSKSSPVIHKRKMGSTRRPLRGNKGQREEIEHHDKNETLDSEGMISTQKDTFSLKDEPSTYESTIQSSKDGAKEQKIGIQEENDVGPVEGSESTDLQSLCSSDLVSEESTAISICHITESQTLTKMSEESQETAGEAERVSAKEDKDIQLKIDSQNKTFDLTTSETEENIQDVSVMLVREIEVAGDSVTVESKMTAESDFLQTSDSNMEAGEVSENAEEEVSGETDTIPEQSHINIIPADSHREEAHSKSSPVIHKRKMGSTRRPLRGNKGQREEIEHHKNETLDSEGMISASASENAEEEVSGKTDTIPVQSDINIIPADSHSEETPLKSSPVIHKRKMGSTRRPLRGNKGRRKDDDEKEIFILEDEPSPNESSYTAVSDISESQTLTKIYAGSQEITGNVQISPAEGDAEPHLGNKPFDSTAFKGEATEENICEASVVVKETEFIGHTATVESNITIMSDLPLIPFTDAKPEAEIEISGKTDTIPKQSDANIIPEDPHGEEAHTKVSLNAHKRKMGSTRRPLRGNKGQREEIEHHDKNETLYSEGMINAEKDTFSLKNDLQSSSSSDLVSEESTTISICHVTESQTLTKINEESQENTGDVERMAAEEEKDLHLKIDLQNPKFDLTTSEAEGTKDFSMTLVREIEVIGDTVTVESNITTESDFLKISPDAHIEAFNVSKKEVSGEADTIAEQSNISSIPQDSHREEAHSKSSPVIQKRKMGSTRRPLKGNKGQRKDDDEKEIFILEDEPSPNESRYTAVSDISESQTLSKSYAGSQEITGDVQIAPVEGDAEPHLENKTFDSTAFKGEATEENICEASVVVKETEFIGHTATVESNITIMSDLPLMPSTDAKPEAEFEISGKTDPHGEEAHTKVSLNAHKRKMGSTRRPLRGNKGQRKLGVESKEKNGDSEGVSEEEDTETHSGIQNQNNVVDQNVTQEIMNIRDNEDEERKTTKTVDMSVQELCDELERSSELEQRSDGPSQDDTLSNETQIHVSSDDVPPTEVVEMHPDSKRSTQKRKIGSTRKRGKRMVNEEEVEKEKEGEATTTEVGTTQSETNLPFEEGITGSPVHQQLFSSSVNKESHDIQDIVSKSDVQTEILKQSDPSSTINPELLIESECSSKAAAEMVSDLPLGDVETYLVPKQSVIPKESQREQSDLNPVVQKRKMGSTRKTLRGNKGQGREGESKKMDRDIKEMTQEQDTEPYLVTSERKTESKFDEEVDQNFLVVASNMFPESENKVKDISQNIHDLTEVSKENRVEHTGIDSNSVNEGINLFEGTKDKFVLTVSHEDVHQTLSADYPDQHVGSEHEQMENIHHFIPTQELKNTQDDVAHENNSRKTPATQEKRRKMGSTRRNPRVMHGKNMADNEDVLGVAEDSQSKEVSSVRIPELKSEMLDIKVENLEPSGQTVPETPENTPQLCDNQLVDADVTKHPQSETVSTEKRRKMGSTRKNLREGRVRGKRDGYEDTETADSEMSLVREDVGEQTIQDYSNQSEDSLLSEIERALNKTSQSSLSCDWELIVKEPSADDLANAPILAMPENSEIKSLQPTPSAHSEPNSPGRRRRKMGSTRKNPRQQLKAETEDEDKEDREIDENLKTDMQKKKDLERVEVSVVHNITENKEYLDVSSAHTSSSQLEESANPVSQEKTSPSVKRKFGSRRANQGKQGLGRLPASDFGNESKDGDHKPDSAEVEDKLHSIDLAVCDPSCTLQPESQPIFHPVSEQRNMETKNEEGASKGTGAGLVSLDHLKNRISDADVVQFNIVMVGNSCVGKTSFIRRFHEGQFTEDYRSTIGVDTCVQNVALPDKIVKLQIWDTAGQERFHSITTQVFHRADGLLFMYEITSSNSFVSVRDWISRARERAPDDAIMMLLGNKNDSLERQVQIQEGADLAREYNMHFMECSAATGANVSESMRTLAELLAQRRSQREKHTTLKREPPQKKSGCC